jgi:hypothetical protein
LNNSGVILWNGLGHSAVSHRGRHVDFSSGNSYRPTMKQAYSAEHPDFVTCHPESDFLSEAQKCCFD